MFSTKLQDKTRRDVLKLAAAGVFAPTLSGWLPLLAKAAPSGGTGKAKSCILLWMDGGPSHKDTWDLKPESKGAGEFKPIKTNLKGLEICEHLPNLAKQADKYAVIRNVCHTLAAHAPGQQYMRSGNKPIPSLEYPNIGSVVAKEHTAPVGMPPYVSLPIARTNGGVETAGYLGVAYSSFAVGGDPTSFGPRMMRSTVSVPGGRAPPEDWPEAGQELATSPRTMTVRSRRMVCTPGHGRTESRQKAPGRRHRRRAFHAGVCAFCLGDFALNSAKRDDSVPKTRSPADSINPR